MKATRITSPGDPALDQLANLLAASATELDAPEAWPGRQLHACGHYGVYEWFIDPRWGGQGWGEEALIEGYLRLSAACLTTTFVITQRMGACRRIAMGDSEAARSRLLPDLIAGKTFATVGISHLTTSRRHLKRPVLRAELSGDHVVLEGYSPWVTGAMHADTLVVGATLDDGRQLLLAVPSDAKGVTVENPARLVGLNASQTGAVRFQQTRVDRKWLLAGPVHGVMQQGAGARTGGLQTSTLAVGLADAAIGYLETEGGTRPGLAAAAEALRSEWTTLRQDLLGMAEGREICTNEQLRSRANSLALRAAQAALSAAKGAGYVLGHPAGRWCREALFFLVWSCPQPVMEANLCELAGIAGSE